LYETNVNRKLVSLVANAVPKGDVDMDLKLVAADASYLRDIGWRGVVNRKRIELAKWLLPTVDVPKVMR
jgi:hypothetical protein